MRKQPIIAVGLLLSALFFACSHSQGIDTADGDITQADQAKIEAWNVVKSINRHWAITENLDSLGLLLHDDMVIFSPGGKERLQGKNNIISAYRAYAQYAETISLSETEPVIQLYNDNKTAIVSYFSDLRIKTSEGEIQDFYCKDMYVLICGDNGWHAVAQHYSFYNR